MEKQTVLPHRGGGKIVNGKLTYGKALNEDIPAMSFVEKGISIDKYTENVVKNNVSYTGEMFYSSMYDTIITTGRGTICGVSFNKFDSNINSLTCDVIKQSWDKYSLAMFLYGGDKLFTGITSYRPITETSVGSKLSVSVPTDINQMSIINVSQDGKLLIGGIYADYKIRYVKLSINELSDTVRQFNIDADSTFQRVGISGSIKSICYLTDDLVAGVVWTASSSQAYVNFYDFNTGTSNVYAVNLTSSTMQNVSGFALSSTEIVLCSWYGSSNALYVDIVDIYGNVVRVLSGISGNYYDRAVYINADCFGVLHNNELYIYYREGKKWVLFNPQITLSNQQYFSCKLFGNKLIYTDNIGGTADGGRLCLYNYDINYKYKIATTFIEGVNMDKLTTSKEGRIYTL